MPWTLRIARSWSRGALFALLAASVSPSSATHPTANDLEFFERHVRPVLVEHCHECHSASSGKAKGGLRLDEASDWLDGGDSGPAVVPGRPEESRLMRATRWTDPELQMPPSSKLPERALSALEAWITRGAPAPATRSHNKPVSGPPVGDGDGTPSSHWAYQPLHPTETPQVQRREWPRSWVDAFILKALEGPGLEPVGDADRATLIRRLYFDLTGLPPSPEDLDEWHSDDRPEAVHLLVDRLLASPRFAEHWARHWLDIVRFAESVTLRGFVFREAWRYRDYVIESFHHDIPLDRFIREQIAGDLLPATTDAERRRHLIASTFLMLGNTNLEEQDKRQLEMDFVDEQLDVIGKAFLGQTIACARCHDHKFDPIPTQDYYALAGILDSTVSLQHANVSTWVEQPLPLEPTQEAELAAHEAAVAELQRQIEATRPSTQPNLVSASSLPGIVVTAPSARRVGEWTLSTHTRPFVGDGYLHDQAAGKGAKTLTFQPDLPRSGSYEVRFAYTAGSNRAPRVPVTIYHAGGETVRFLDQKEAPPIDGLFVSLGTFVFETNGFASVLVANEGTSGHVIANAVQWLPASPVEPSPRNIAAPLSPPTTDSAPSLADLEARLKELQRTGPRRPMVMAPREGTNIHDLAIHRRGSVHNLGEIVPRGFLSVVPAATPSIPASQSGRLQLADWLVAPDNPLTPRVMVNRVWLWLMGEGLVRSPDNFGTTGEPPTHPDLLDGLARRFAAPPDLGGLGWSLKSLVRELVLSRTYQLASTPTSSLLAADPDNRLFGRAVRKRLTAEQLRDAMLAVSGALELDPPHGPTFPDTQRTDYGFIADDPRRSLFLPVFRNALPEVFEAFDFPSPNQVAGTRHASTVPTQALFLLNHPFVRDQARRAASRLSACPETSASLAATEESARHQIRRAYRLALGRPPSDAERALLLDRRGTAALEEEELTHLMHALLASIDFRYLH